MIFFFGSSRSWAAREARRKARHMAQKKRRAIIKTALSVFSFVVLCISVWSLTKMKHVTYPLASETRIIGRALGNVSSAAVKTSEKPKLEMPPPPPEPSPPDHAVKETNSSTAVGGKVDSVERHDAGASSSERIQNQSGGEPESTRQGTNQLPKTVQPVHRSPSVTENTVKTFYHSTSADRKMGGATAVRGMNQDESEDAERAHSEVARQSGPGTTQEQAQHSVDNTKDGTDGEIRKLEAVDYIDSEEGGEAPLITLPQKKGSQSYQRNGGQRKGARGAIERPREKRVAKPNQQFQSKTIRRGYASDLRPVQRGMGESRMSQRGDEHFGEERGNSERRGIGLTKEASSEQRVAAKRRSYNELGQNGNRVGSNPVRESTTRNSRISGDRYSDQENHRNSERVENGEVREVANANRVVSGSHLQENESPRRIEARNVAVRDGMENRVERQSMRAQDLTYVTNVDSRSTSSVDTRRSDSYMSFGSAADSAVSGAGVIGSSYAVRNGGAVKA